MGLNVRRYKASAFAASGFLGAFGGAMLALLSTYLDPTQFGITQSIYYLAIAVVGGMLSTVGIIVASAIFAFIPEWLQAFQSYLGLVFALLLLGFIVLRPDGLASLRPLRLPLNLVGASNERATAEGEDVLVRFGGIVALGGVSLEVGAGAIQAVIGPNGAGKSTLLNVITGLYRASEGAIVFAGRRIDGAPPHLVSRMGIARTFQNTEPFGEMSAVENVMVALTDIMLTG
jgi:ABC-type multidrug transport system fused ATPase/permease subunit